MKTVADIKRESANSWQTALVVGKGPTSDRVADVPSLFTIFTMNHAIRLVHKAFAAHFVDFEAYIDCDVIVGIRAKYLIMPERPHEKMNPGRTIQELVKVYPRLADMEKEGRLVTYRKVGCIAGKEPPGTIPCLYFSSEALFGVIGMLGFKSVLSVGIDGGASYGKGFADLKPLTNGQPSFDIQMAELYRIAINRGFTWDRLFQETRYA